MTSGSTPAVPSRQGSAPARSSRRSFEEWSTLVPGWWVVLAWIAMDAVHVWSTRHGAWGLDRTATRILAGALFAVAAAAVRATGDGGEGRADRDRADRSDRLLRRGGPIRPYAVSVALTAGLLSVLVAPSGIGEVPLFLAAARIPFAFPERAARWVVGVATVATAVVIGYASHSFAGAAAGVGVPFLAERTVDRRALVEQRDRARAMVVEVEAGRQAEAQAVALRERAHIAREMHDVLAHSLAGLSLQLQAARALAQAGDDRALEAIDRAAELARDGLAEARSAVGTLAAPALRGVGDLPDLVEVHPGEIAFTVAGAPQAVSAEAGHAVYRAVQESLTNAARYAPGSVVRIEVRWQAATLDVAIEDDGAAPGHQPLLGEGGGLGLSGMRERLRAVGGTVEAGPTGPTGHGWRVALSVPTEDRT